MKFCFMDENSLVTLRSNLPTIVSYFSQDNGAWVETVLGKNPYVETKYGDIPDFELDMSSDEPFATEAKNAEIVYKNLKFLSDSQASDERIWAALCIKDFWKYVQYRWIRGDVTEAKIKQHFFYGYGARRSLTRNALSRLWWIGRLTYDESHAEDPFWLTKFVCENADYIMHVLERNTSNSPMIVRAFLSAVIRAREENCVINTNTVGELSKYLNLLGGAYILDCVPEETIHNKVLEKAKEITERIRKDAEAAEEEKRQQKERIALREASVNTTNNNRNEKHDERPKARSVLERIFGGKR